jgi:hypothetical protein
MADTFTWMWRRLHALGNLRSSWNRPASDYIDVGYCLDRYSIEDEGGNVTRSLP